MPAVSTREIVQAIQSAIAESGGASFYQSLGARPNPKDFLVTHGDNSFLLRAYAWNLTFGGRSALPDEYRIQLTGVKPPLQAMPHGHTILVGFHADSGLFAGFDLNRHADFSPGSPSVQTSLTAVLRSAEDGISFFRKSNEEVAVGIRPDHFLTYAINQYEIHLHGADSAIIQLMELATTGKEVPEVDMEGLTPERVRLVGNVSRLSRDTRFRTSVMNAYRHRCAITGLQLRLVQAAHILPVSAPESPDTVDNGIALSPTLHAAFDSGVIFLDPARVIRINAERMDDLVSQGLGGGFELIRSIADRMPTLPANKRDWPSSDLIIQANRYRNIVGY